MPDPGSLAGLTLLGITVWLIQTRRSSWFVALPMAFLIVTTMVSLVLFVRDAAAPDAALQARQAGLAAAVLLVLALWLVVEAGISIRGAYRARHAAAAT